MKGSQVSILESRATEVYEENLQKVRDRLMEEARPVLPSRRYRVTSIQSRQSLDSID